MHSFSMHLCVRLDFDKGIHGRLVGQVIYHLSEISNKRSKFVFMGHKYVIVFGHYISLNT